jgi:formate hydrogenlyase subunit 6/NADH:ubiquinone oxidoreductase subunit I/flavodoxin
MSKNAVFYFSGTGNSLRAAQIIAEGLENCEFRAISTAPTLTGAYDRIGFVFPHYALGAPNMVRRWLETLDVSENLNAYFFAVETYGAYRGNCLAQVRDILRGKGVTLQYGGGVKMVANNIANYKMTERVSEQTAESDRAVRKIALDIRRKVTNSIRKSNALFAIIYRKITASYPEKGLRFNVSVACTGCTQCSRTCPAGNIVMRDGKPVFGAQCEWCMACIQWCPKAAINYKKKTRGRKRYHHPDITPDEMMTTETT